MKKILSIVAVSLFLALPNWVGAGALVDLALTDVTTGTTTVASGGVSTFTIQDVEGTYNPGTKKPYDVDFSSGDTILEDLDQFDPTKEWSLHIYEVEHGQTYTGSSPDATFSIGVYWSNISDDFPEYTQPDGGVSNSGVSELVSGTIGGNSNYVTTFPPMPTRYAKFEFITSGTTAFSKAKMKALIPQ